MQPPQKAALLISCYRLLVRNCSKRYAENYAALILGDRKRFAQWTLADPRLTVAQSDFEHERLQTRAGVAENADIVTRPRMVERTVLLSTNPLEEITSLRDIEIVIKGGQVWRAAELLLRQWMMW